MARQCCKLHLRNVPPGDRKHATSWPSAVRNHDTCSGVRTDANDARWNTSMSSGYGRPATTTVAAANWALVHRGGRGDDDAMEWGDDGGGHFAYIEDGVEQQQEKGRPRIFRAPLNRSFARMDSDKNNHASPTEFERVRCRAQGPVTQDGVEVNGNVVYLNDDGTFRDGRCVGITRHHDSDDDDSDDDVDLEPVVAYRIHDDDDDHVHSNVKHAWPTAYVVDDVGRVFHGMFPLSFMGNLMPQTPNMLAYYIFHALLFAPAWADNAPVNPRSRASGPPPRGQTYVNDLGDVQDRVRLFITYTTDDNEAPMAHVVAMVRGPYFGVTHWFDTFFAQVDQALQALRRGRRGDDTDTVKTWLPMTGPALLPAALRLQRTYRGEAAGPLEGMDHHPSGKTGNKYTAPESPFSLHGIMDAGDLDGLWRRINPGVEPARYLCLRPKDTIAVVPLHANVDDPLPCKVIETLLNTQKVLNDSLQPGSPRSNGAVADAVKAKLAVALRIIQDPALGLQGSADGDIVTRRDQWEAGLARWNANPHDPLGLPLQSIVNELNGYLTGERGLDAAHVFSHRISTVHDVARRHAHAPAWSADDPASLAYVLTKREDLDDMDDFGRTLVWLTERFEKTLNIRAHNLFQALFILVAVLDGQVVLKGVDLHLLVSVTGKPGTGKSYVLKTLTDLVGPYVTVCSYGSAKHMTVSSRDASLGNNQDPNDGDCKLKHEGNLSQFHSKHAEAVVDLAKLVADGDGQIVSHRARIA